MSPRFLVYYGAVVAGGLLLLLSGIPEMTHAAVVPALFWLVLLIAVDAAPVKLPGGGFITVSSTLDYAGILILGPAVTALVEFLATLFLQLVVQRRPFRKAIFNASTFAGTVVVAGAVFRLFGGVPGAPPTIPGIVVPLIAMGVTYFTLNSWLVTFVIALAENRNPWRIWQVNYIWTIFHTVASLPFAAAIAVGNAALGFWGVLLFIVPILLARYSFQLYINTKQDLLDFAAVLAGVIDEVDPYTRRHSQRVGRSAALIAREMGLPERDVEVIEYAGLLHDIGKIKTVQRDLLLKATRLSPEERVQMSDHAPMGAEMLAHVRAFRRVAPIVRHHHERLDGKGYPDGLMSGKVPLGSRIVLVADAFDAMTTDRVYRPALSVEAALSELNRHAGSQFDPRVVAALERLIHAGDIAVDPGVTVFDPHPVTRPDLVNAGLAKS